MSKDKLSYHKSVISQNVNRMIEYSTERIENLEKHVSKLDDTRLSLIDLIDKFLEEKSIKKLKEYPNLLKKYKVMRTTQEDNTTNTTNTTNTKIVQPVISSLEEDLYIRRKPTNIKKNKEKELVFKEPIKIKMPTKPKPKSKSNDKPKPKSKSNDKPKPKSKSKSNSKHKTKPKDNHKRNSVEFDDEGEDGEELMDCMC